VSPDNRRLGVIHDILKINNAEMSYTSYKDGKRELFWNQPSTECTNLLSTLVNVIIELARLEELPLLALALSKEEVGLLRPLPKLSLRGLLLGGPALEESYWS